MKNITLRTLTEHINALKAGEYSSRELTLAYLENIDAAKELNAYITVCAERALASADESDKRIREGKQLSALDGIPYAAKDNISVRGLPLTCGSKMLEGYVSPYDATVIATLSERGAILLGKTNLDEFAMGTGTESSYFGRTKNPLDPGKVPGGSSGGSAAAVAAHLAAFTLGSDTGGSVRQPAAFCGVVGLRPTYSALSRYGLVGFAPSLDTVGILTSTVNDSATVLQNIARRDALDATSTDAPESYGQIEARGSLSGKKVALVKEFSSLSLSSEVIDAINYARLTLSEQGAELIELSLPSLVGAYASYYTVSSAEASSNLSRFDGVRYGYRSANAKTLDELYTLSRSEGFGQEVKRRILFGAMALSENFKHDIYDAAIAARSRITQELSAALQKVDALLIPTATGTAYSAGERKNELFDAYTKDDLLCVPASLAGLPAISVPYAKNRKMPVGIQLVGNRFCESTLFEMGIALQKGAGADNG
ncbi:MAG: Asp-tRNA(Asn)/Glu-tRNA(Gln) amidotransferase subunit GatA [Clostridia bacterium]|nr:Asp-tRNA(Asn)/Glu-tRNA(Gln) amidotransferase subunit GatA [Clostridia bacterium]